MRRETRAQIKTFLTEFTRKIVSKADEYELDEIKKAFPFHGLFFRDEALVAFKLQRSIVTSMGMTLYPRLAELVASDKHQNVHRDHAISGALPEEMCNTIERIVTDLRTGQRSPNHTAELEEILSAQIGPEMERHIIADLYIGDFADGEFFAELKTPKPNLDICAESKKKLLYFLAMKKSQGQEAFAFLAFPYNPYVYREAYDWAYTKLVMDLVDEVLIGEEFWNFIGGEGMYETLLEILAEVKIEVPLA